MHGLLNELVTLHWATLHCVTVKRRQFIGRQLTGATGQLIGATNNRARLKQTTLVCIPDPKSKWIE